MTLARSAFLAILGGVCAYAVYLFAYGPYKCLITLHSVSGATQLASQTSRPDQVVLRARNNLAALVKVDRFCASEIRVYMLKAANQRLLGRTAEALATLGHALAIEPRPEVYFFHAIVSSEAAQFDDAVESWTHAVRFDPRLQGNVETYSPELGRRVRERVATLSTTKRQP